MLGVDDQDEVSWGTRFKDNGEITDLVKESSVLERFLAEVRALCAQGTVINELTQGSIVVHVTSPTIKKILFCEASTKQPVAVGSILRAGVHGVKCRSFRLGNL